MDELHFREPVTSQMINQMGYISEGMLGGLITLAVTRTMKEHKKGDLLIDSAMQTAPNSKDVRGDFFP